jgi:uncharacterized protein
MNFIKFICAVAVGCFSVTGFAGSYDELISASKMGDVPAMHDLMKRGLDPDSTDRSGNTLLTIAAAEGNEKLVKVLLAYKPKLNLRNANGETALQLAAYRGFETIVKDLLAAGARTDTPGWPALIYATYTNHESIVEMLLNAGADKDAQADNQMTALMFAAEMGKPSLVRLLLAAGVDPDISTRKGDTAYSFSLKAGNIEVTELIEEALLKHQSRMRKQAEEDARTGTAQNQSIDAVKTPANTEN